MRHLSSRVLFTLLASILCFTALTSCTQKAKRDPNKAYNELTPDALTAIRVEKAINVRFTQEEGSPSITVVCKKEYAPLLNVHMEGSVLVATYKDKNPQIVESGIDVIVTAPAINEIEVDMAAIVNLGDELKLNGDLRITCNHAGSVKCKKVECNNLILKATNASVIQLAGITANDVSARATNSASIYLEGTTNSSTMQQVFDKQIRFEKLTTKNGHVELVQDTPLPVIEKKGIPQKPDSAKSSTKPATTATSANSATTATKPKSVAPASSAKSTATPNKPTNTKPTSPKNTTSANTTNAPASPNQ